MGSRKHRLSIVGLIAWSSTAACMIFSVLEAAALSNIRLPLVPVAVATSTLNLLSLLCIVVYCYHAVWRNYRPTNQSIQVKRLMVAGSILVSITALMVSLVLIVLLKARWKDILAITSSTHITGWTGLFQGHIVVWAISSTSQILLYLLPLYHTKTPKVQSVAISGPRDSVMSEYYQTRPSNLYMPDLPQAVMTIGALPSPTFSSRSSHSLKSFRESLRNVVRPVTSRSTLISRSEACSVSLERQSLDNASHTDPFDSWDTSSVSLHALDAVTQTAPFKGTTLEPIPGSRPNSPACALDGPFISGLPEEEMDDFTPPPKMMPDISRPPSPAVSEAHIHPLFRSATPEPAPPATLGTSIIASPLASQAISCPAPTFSRMRSNSRVASPSPLNQARSFTRDRATSLTSRSRSSSPPSRGMTPPIPDFVLNSSPRSSMSGSRRVNLQYSQDR